MLAPIDGATYGDAIIFTVKFAEQHPYRFLLTVPLTLALALGFAVFITKYVVVGPLIDHKRAYDKMRFQTRQTPKPKGSK